MPLPSFIAAARAAMPYPNAILIKELKQELRARSFVNSFIWFHVVMLIFTLVTYSGDESYSRGSEEQTMFWVFLFLPLLVVLPLRAGASFSKESKAQELELIFLTRVTAWKLAFNKWLALNLQGLLLLIAALPYAIVRHFLGGLNWLEGLGILAAGLLAMMALSALALLGSSWTSRFGQVPLLLIIFGFMVVIPGLLSAVSLFLKFFSGRHIYSPAMPIVGLCYFAVFILLLLEFAAANIAPAAENHALRERLIGLATVAISLLLIALGQNTELVQTTTLVILTVIIIHGLCRQPVYIQSIYAPFCSGSALRRLAGAFLYPGWPSTVLYLLALAPLCAFALHGSSWQPRDIAYFTLAGLTFLLLPLVVMNALPSFRWNRFFFYLIFQMVQMLLVTIVFLSLDYKDRNSCLSAMQAGAPLKGGFVMMSLLPVTSLFHFASPTRNCVELSALLVTAFFVAVFMLVQLKREWKKISAMCRQAAANSKEV